MCVHEELWFQPPSPCPFVFSFPVLRSHPANARILFFRGDTLRDAHMLIESQETHVPISLSRYKFGWTLEEREKKKGGCYEGESALACFGEKYKEKWSGMTWDHVL